MLILGEFSFFISLSLQCPLCFLSVACSYEVRVITWLIVFPTIACWLTKLPSHLVISFCLPLDTCFVFFGSCTISCLVYRPAPRECPYPRGVGKVNSFLCYRITFFLIIWLFTILLTLVLKTGTLTIFFSVSFCYQQTRLLLCKSQFPSSLGAFPSFILSYYVTNHSKLLLLILTCLAQWIVSTYGAWFIVAHVLFAFKGW